MSIRGTSKGPNFDIINLGKMTDGNGPVYEWVWLDVPRLREDFDEPLLLTDPGVYNDKSCSSTCGGCKSCLRQGTNRKRCGDGILHAYGTYNQNSQGMTFAYNVLTNQIGLYNGEIHEW